MKRILFIVFFFILVTVLGYCQDSQEIIKQVAKVYTGGANSGNGLIAGFSIGGLIGGIVFGGIGFVAFVYGKRNSEFRPMLIGLLLMGYPYFLKNTFALYAVGIALTFILFAWRE